MKKNLLWAAAFGLLMSASLVSCDDDDPIDPVTPPTDVNQLSGYFVLNSGKMGSNNASLSFYNPWSEEVQSDLFKEVNNRGLGDTANDMLIYGDKIYIAVYGSQVIEVTDLQGKSLKQIKSETEAPLQPRYMTSHEGKVYVSLYDGYVARLDTASLEIEATVAVGRNPEQLAVSNNKLYVANSGGLDYNTELGYDKTVSVVDLTSFTETKKLDVVLNPCNMAVDSEGDIYLVSLGNYGDIPNTLQRIIPQTDEVSVITTTNATELVSAGDELFMMYSQYDENWNQKISYIRYDAINDAVVTDQWITEPIAKPYKIGLDRSLGMLFITESDYTNNGDVYCFSSNGSFVSKFEVGLNPVKVLAHVNE